MKNNKKVLKIAVKSMISNAEIKRILKELTSVGNEHTGEMERKRFRNLNTHTQSTHHNFNLKLTKCLICTFPYIFSVLLFKCYHHALLVWGKRHMVYITLINFSGTLLPFLCNILFPFPITKSNKIKSISLYKSLTICKLTFQGKNLTVTFKCHITKWNNLTLYRDDLIIMLCQSDHFFFLSGT